jgi:hypothetical protein
MEPQFAVILYSKYSTSSDKLLNYINSFENNIIKLLSLQPLCIDNKKLREQIMKDKNIEIETVPCILVILPDGGVEKYDNSFAFNWIQENINKYLPHPPPPPPPPPPKPSPIEIEQQKFNEIKKNKEKEQRRQEKQKEREREKNKQKYEQKYISKTKSDNYTAIEDLASEEEEEYKEEEEEEDLGSDRYRTRIPIKMIRKNEGEYEQDDDIFNEEDKMDMREANIMSVRSKKGENIIEKAKKLAKGRETITKIKR